MAETFIIINLEIDEIGGLVADEESDEKEAILPLVIPKPGDEQAARLANGRKVYDQGTWVRVAAILALGVVTIFLMFVKQFYALPFFLLTIPYVQKSDKFNPATISNFAEQGRVVVLPPEIIQLAMRAAPHLSEEGVCQALRADFAFASTYLADAVRDLEELPASDDECKQIEAAVVRELRKALPRELPVAEKPDESEIRRVGLNKLYPPEDDNQ